MDIRASSSSILVNSLATYLSEVGDTFQRNNGKPMTTGHGGEMISLTGVSMRVYLDYAGQFSLTCAIIRGLEKPLDKEFVRSWIKTEEDSFYPSTSVEEAVHFSDIKGVGFKKTVEDVTNIAATFEKNGGVLFGHSGSAFDTYVAVFVQLEDHVVVIRISE